VLADIGQYLLDLADHWAAFMTGGIPAALILIVERIRSKQLPLRAFVFFLAFGFVAAAYQEHRKLNDELGKSNSANASLQTDLKAVKHQLTEALKIGQAPSAHQVTSPPLVKFGPGAKSVEMDGTKMRGKGTLIDSEAENLKLRKMDLGQ
jgi:hypothetical protein